MVLHTFNPSTQEAEAGSLVWVAIPGQPRLQNETLSQTLTGDEQT